MYVRQVDVSLSRDIGDIRRRDKWRKDIAAEMASLTEDEAAPHSALIHSALTPIIIR